MIVEEIKGDLLETEIKHIGHGVNCQAKMGSGVAKVLYTKWPKVKEDYLDTCKVIPKEDRLGFIERVDLGEKIVWNMFTQYNFGKDGKLYVDYEALRDCFITLTKCEIDHIAIPKIGCGLAGGDWEKVKKIINEVTGDSLKVTVYYI